MPTNSDTPQKYFDDQFDDETVLLVFRKHPIVMRMGLLIAMFMPLLGIIPAAIKPSLGFGWFFGGLAIGLTLAVMVMMPYWIAWYYSVFIVTDQRFIQITQKGLFHKSNIDMGLNQIQSINYEIPGFQATLLGFGTLLVQTYMGDLLIHDVHKPAKIQKKMALILRDQNITPNQYPVGQEMSTDETQD